jgi:hypothetical protein
MVRIIICSGLLIVFLPKSPCRRKAAESKQNTAACETVEEIATAVAGYGIAVANCLMIKELGRMPRS